MTCYSNCLTISNVLNCSIIFYDIHVIILVYVVNFTEGMLTGCASVFGFTYEETNPNK